MTADNRSGDSAQGVAPPSVIWRETNGIPHIQAATDAGAWAGLGTVHARDRLFQMDHTRRRAQGRMAEWLGRDMLEADRLARRLGGAAVAQANVMALGEEARAMLEAYCAGVNAEIGRLRATGGLPEEYALLGQAEGPEPWTPADCIAVTRQIGLAMGSVWMKLFRAAALPAVGAGLVSLLRHDDDGADRFVLPPGAEGQRWMASLADLAPAAEALLALGSDATAGGGSNNWVVSGDLTTTGLPIMAGDPHRELEVPAMYTQAHLCGAGFDVIGLTIPGAPGFPHVGHNADVAWSVTHAMADIQDLFIERFDDGARHYLHRGTWHPALYRQETIAVRGEADEPLEIWGTAHGPVICGDPRAGHAIAFASPQLDPEDRSFDCLPRMLRATGVAELHEAVRGWGLIDHNLVAADRSGRIGHRVRASLPRRGHMNGWLPVPGWTGAHDWNGMVPFEDMPAAIDPKGCRIVTANNRVVPDGGAYYFCTDATPPWRAKRIAARLDALGSLSAETMAPIMMDRHSGAAPVFRQHLARHRAATPDAKQLAARIAAWDGKMDADRVEPTLYARFRLALAGSALRAAGLDAPGGIAARLVSAGDMLTQMWWILPGLL
ncbi:MAG TPA: penicillin acylase family protein, partial [Paenirhodobacter sp.]